MVDAGDVGVFRCDAIAYRVLATAT